MAVSLVDALVVGIVAGGVLCLGMAAVAWRHRDVPAALPFGALMVAVAAWAFADAAYLLADSTNVAYVADRVIRAAGAQVPPLWVLFVLAFAGYEAWVNWRTIAVLWSYVVVYLFLMVTAPLHGLVSTQNDVVFLTTNGIREPVVAETLVPDIHLLFGYVVMIAGFVILVSFLVRSRAVYRKQTGIIVLGSVAPVVVNGALQMGITPHPGIDLTPLAFVVSGVIFGWSLVKYDFLTVTPMAGDVLVDELPDPVFLLDEDDHVVDCNPAARSAFDLTDPHGDPLTSIEPTVPTDLNDGESVQVAATGQSDGSDTRYFECSVSLLEDQYGTQRNTLVVFRDVSGQQRRQRRLETLQEATRQFLAASTDEEIATISVEYADEVLDATGTAVFLTDGGVERLEPIATSDAIGAEFERDEPPGGMVADVLQEAYESDERQSQELPGAVGGTPDRALALPLGDHGVLWIGMDADSCFTPDDEGFATILARTTQVALTRVERESALRQSRSSVERRSEQIAFFNGVLRHTLRNALLVIQGRADHLRGAVPDSEATHIDTIVEWCDDLAALSEEIRAVNDTVTATESERLDTVDLSTMLVQCIRNYQAEHDGVSVEMDVDGGIEVQANELASRAIDSLLENAIIHNDREDPHIEIWTVHAADRVQVHVADDGPGMDDEMKSIVFERDLSTSQTASGFGLYFVSVLMNLYGGTVWFEDNHPRGTIAVLEFQVADDEDGDTEDADDRSASDETAPATDIDASFDDLDAEID